MIKIIVAYDENRVIGNKTFLPWDNEEDLKHFKETTLHQKILLGDNTFKSIPFLKDRIIYVLTKNKKFKVNNKNVHVIYDYKMIIDQYFHNRENDIIICGGAEIYKLFIDYSDELIITYINGKHQGDKYFPKWNENDFLIRRYQHHKNFTIIWYQRIEDIKELQEDTKELTEKIKKANLK